MNEEQEVAKFLKPEDAGFQCYRDLIAGNFCGEGKNEFFCEY